MEVTSSPTGADSDSSCTPAVGLGGAVPCRRRPGRVAAIWRDEGETATAITVGEHGLWATGPIVCQLDRSGLRKLIGGYPASPSQRALGDA